MKIIDKIYHAKQAPRNKNVLWIDGEKKMYVYGNKWENLSNSGNSGGVTPEEVIKASQGYPYNVLYEINGEDVVPLSSIFKHVTFEGDLRVIYSFTPGVSDMALFTDDSFLANHVTKVNIMGNDIEDLESLPSIVTMMNDTYAFDKIDVIFTLDTDTIEGDLFGFESYDNNMLKPDEISVNCKVKSLDTGSIWTNVSMLNSPTEILEQGSIKGSFGYLVLPLALKNLEENAFAKYGKGENDTTVEFLMMMSPIVPESLPQSSLSLADHFGPLVFFPALLGERTYKDYVKDVFNFDVTTEAGAAKVCCFDVSTGAQVTFIQNQ